MTQVTKIPRAVVCACGETLSTSVAAKGGHVFTCKCGAEYKVKAVEKLQPIPARSASDQPTSDTIRSFT